MADRGTVARFCVRYFLYPLQGLLIGSIYCAIRTIPLGMATRVGSFLFRNIGQRMRVARVAEQNVRRAFPKLSDAEVTELLERIWHNLGQGAAEFAHMDRFTTEGLDRRVTFVGEEHLARMRGDGPAGIVVSAHLGNWELAARLFGRTGISFGQIYRGADNPFIDRLFKKARTEAGITLVPKGREGAVQMVRLMRDGLHFGAMMDQKLNEGMPIPFFGHDAMTATGPVEIALRNGGPIVPARCIRLPDSHFRIEFFPPIEIESTGDKKTDVEATLRRINKIIEGWIRDHPEQWFWLHRRWPKE